MKKLRRIFVAISKGELEREFEWLYERWGEDAVKTFLVSHPEMIDKGLTLLGIGELYHPKLRKRGRSRIDMIFRKADTYYVVEAKSGSRYAWKQLLEEVVIFECDMKRHGKNYDEIVPVLVNVQDKREKWQDTWTEEEKKFYQELWKLCNKTL